MNNSYFRENRLKDSNSSNITNNYGTSISALSLPSRLDYGKGSICSLYKKLHELDLDH